MSCQAEHLGFHQAMDPVQDQPPLMPYEDVQRVGEIGVSDAVCMFWVRCRPGQEFTRGHVEPVPVAAPPRQLETPTELFEREAAARELERPEQAAVPINRQQPAA